MTTNSLHLVVGRVIGRIVVLSNKRDRQRGMCCGRRKRDRTTTQLQSRDNADDGNADGHDDNYYEDDDDNANYNNDATANCNDRTCPSPGHSPPLTYHVVSVGLHGKKNAGNEPDPGPAATCHVE